MPLTTEPMFFPYEFDRFAKPLLRAFGVRPDRDGVRVTGTRVLATFGPLNVSIDVDNIRAAAVTGPYRWVKAVGPRLSMADHGLTFGTTAKGGVCLDLDEVAPAVIGPWDHPGLTVTVADPAGLVAAIERRS